MRYQWTMCAAALLLSAFAFAGCEKKTEEETQPIERPSLIDEGRSRIDPNAPGDTAEDHFQRAMEYSRNGLFDRAHVQFYKAIEKNPKHAGAHNGLGYTYANVENNMSMAQYHWEQCLECGPTREEAVGAHFGLGVLFTKRGLRRAEEEKRPELEAERYNPETIKLLRSSSEYFSMAEANFREVQRLDNNNAEVLYELGTLNLARGDTGAALASYRNYLQRFGPTDLPQIRKCYRAMAIAQEAQDKLFESIQSLKLALNTYPEMGGTKTEDGERVALRMEIDRLEKKILRGGLER